MDQKNLITLTNLINKLPMEAIDKLLEIAKEQASRFLPAKIRISCPLCNGKDIVKNGHKCGKQEYKCKCCGHTFVSTSNTMMANSRQPVEIWEEVIHDTLDETFVLESYKGKKLPESLGRKPRKHGAKAAKRGISGEYVCICAGVQRNGASMAHSVNRAKPSGDELLQVFSDHICDGTLLLCDGLRSYPVLESSASSVKDVNKEKNDHFFNLNTVNGFHSSIKNTYDFYRGVATKYLNRYNALFSVRYKNRDHWMEKLMNSLREISSVSRYHTVKDTLVSGLLCI